MVKHHNRKLQPKAAFFPWCVKWLRWTRRTRPRRPRRMPDDRDLHAAKNILLRYITSEDVVPELPGFSWLCDFASFNGEGRQTIICNSKYSAKCAFFVYDVAAFAPQPLKNKNDYINLKP